MQTAGLILEYMNLRPARNICLLMSIIPQGLLSEKYIKPAMLEYGPRSSHAGRELPKTGDLLYPSELRRRRLFLKDVSGEELGYLSFQDDRLYYIVIPLFEQRRVQVRIRVSEEPASQGKGKNTSFYQNLDFYIRLDPLQHQFLPENLNLHIEKILKEYIS